MKLSVITPVLNAVESISSTIESVLRFSPEVLHEYIIVDGGSTDGTLDVIERYRNPKIRLITGDDDGIYDAMNKGIKVSTGEIVGIINADDYYLTEAVEEALVSFDEDPALEFVHGCLRLLKSGGQKKKAPDRSWKGRLGMNPPVMHPTLFVRRSTYEKVGFFRTNFRIAADQDFYYRAFDKHVREKFLSTPLACMRAGGVGSGLFSSGFELVDIQHQRKSMSGFLASIFVYKNRRIRSHPETPENRIPYLRWALVDFCKRKFR